MIAEYPLDHEASLKVRRSGANATLSLRVKEYPPAKMVAEYPFELTSAAAMPVDNGELQTVTLTPATRTRLNMAQDTPGVEVRALLPGSAADRVGIREGEVILRVQAEPASSSETVQRELKLAETSNRRQLALLVLGSEGPRWVALPVSAGKAF
jgi:serine protease Do